MRARFIYAGKANVPEYRVTSAAATYRIVTDQVGSVRVVENTASGAVVERIDWDEFGNVLTDSAPGTQPFGFAGGPYDSDTGLTRFGARDYDPATGKWTTKDTAGLEGGLNVYEYAANDPINQIDPSGNDWRDWDADSLNNGIQGFADDFTFGATAAIRNAFGLNAGLDRCSTAYKVGGYASLGVGLGRLAYAGGAKALPYLVRGGGAADLAYALRVSAARNTLKRIFRLGLFPNYRAWDAAAVVLKYDGDAAKIIAKATQTSLGWNLAGAGAAGIGGAMLATSGGGCGCQ
jgi:RHS repeat-associated protein